MHRNTVAMIWIGGIAVAVIAYATDPGAILETALDLLAAGIAATDRFVHDLSTIGSAVIRALAVGLFVTFVALAVLAIRQGGKGKTALVLVSAVFLLLLRDGAGASNGRWVAAFALAAVGALVMTARVRRRAP
jgi:hypothetical protein